MQHYLAVRFPLRRLWPAVLGLLLVLAASGATSGMTGPGHTPSAASAAVLAGDDTKIGTGVG